MLSLLVSNIFFNEMLIMRDNYTRAAGGGGG